MREMDELVDEFLNSRNAYHMEGERGVRNLGTLVSALGYGGAFSPSQIHEFLADNSGAIEAIVEWIKERNIPEWKEKLEEQVEPEEMEEDEDTE